MLSVGFQLFLELRSLSQSSFGLQNRDKVNSDGQRLIGYFQRIVKSIINNLLNTDLYQSSLGNLPQAPGLSKVRESGGQLGNNLNGVERTQGCCYGFQGSKGFLQGEKLMDIELLTSPCGGGGGEVAYLLAGVQPVDTGECFLGALVLDTQLIERKGHPGLHAVSEMREPQFFCLQLLRQHPPSQPSSFPDGQVFRDHPAH